jgi:hypothetical protein
MDKSVLELGERYWDLKYQKQAKKLGITIGSVKDSCSDKSQQLKIVWQFSNDFTNDTTNDFNSDLSKANQEPPRAMKEKSESPDNRYMHTFGLEEDNLPSLKKLKEPKQDTALNNTQRFRPGDLQPYKSDETKNAMLI